MFFVAANRFAKEVQEAHRMTGVTTLLQRIQGNDRQAMDELFTLMYDDLSRLARSRLAASGHQTLLDTSALVNEAYLRFNKLGQLELKDRQHFLAYAATTLRSVVVDFVRRRSAEQRGGDLQQVTLNTDIAESLGVSDDEILAVHDALATLADIDPRLVKVVEMRYFAGLTEDDIAAALGVTDRTVRRDWERARLLLAEMLKH
jgi:RNA polymerase sigma factor (TIGR02999 family)